MPKMLGLFYLSKDLFFFKAEQNCIGSYSVLLPYFFTFLVIMKYSFLIVIFEKKYHVDHVPLIPRFIKMSEKFIEKNGRIITEEDDMTETPTRR